MQDGDWCITVAEATGVTVEQLLALNPSVNAECTNLQVGRIAPP